MTVLNNGDIVLNVFFTQTGTTPDMVARNYNTHVTQMGVQTLQEITHGGMNTQYASLAPIAGDIIKPDMGSTRLVNIPNGFNQVRLRFLIVVGNPANPNGVRYYYSGYTDYDGVSRETKSLDHNMRLYINNAIKVQTVGRVDPTTGVTYPHTEVTECTHLLHPQSLGAAPSMYQPNIQLGASYNVINKPSYVRPVDLAYTLQVKRDTSSLGHGLGIDPNMDATMPLLDVRTSVTPALANRMNNIPAVYLSHTLNGFHRGYMMQSADIDPSATNPYEATVAALRDPSLSQNYFLATLMAQYDYRTNGFITWGAMLAAHPELLSPQVVQYYNNRAVGTDIFIAQRGEYDGLGTNTTIQSQLVTQVLQSIPAFLLKNLIVEASLFVTNATMDGSVDVVMKEAISFANVPPNWILQRTPGIEAGIKSIVFSNMRGGMYAPFTLNLRVNAFGETFVELVYNFEATLRTVVPSYCDAITTLQLAPDGATLDHMAQDIDYLTNTVIESSNHHPQLQNYY